jgi:hypothetical protein
MNNCLGEGLVDRPLTSPREVRGSRPLPVKNGARTFVIHLAPHLRGEGGARRSPLGRRWEGEGWLSWVTAHQQLNWILLSLAGFPI